MSVAFQIELREPENQRPDCEESGRAEHRDRPRDASLFHDGFAPDRKVRRDRGEGRALRKLLVG